MKLWYTYVLSCDPNVSSFLAFNGLILQNAAYDSVREALISRNVNLGKYMFICFLKEYLHSLLFTNFVNLFVCPELGLS